MRVAPVLVVLLVSSAWSSSVSAQVAPAVADAVDGAAAPASGDDAASEGEATASTGAADAGESPARAAVVLVGDSNDEAQSVARSVEAALGETVRFPSDAVLRASLVGVTGDDAIPSVVRDRRALGSTETEDVPHLASLGDRADAELLLVVRRRAGARELVVFDVAHRAFFDGSFALDGELDGARLARFVRSRARAARRTPAVEAESTTRAEAAVERAVQTTTDPAQPADQPDWLEQNWAYLVAGALLAGAITYVVVETTSGSSTTTPMLRFQPGGS